MNKLYTRIDWENNTTPALNETNLNLMSKGIDDIDNRVVYLANEVIGDTTAKMNTNGSNADSEVTFSGAFAVGSRSGSVGTSSVAEGNSVEASGSYSHAEGSHTTASGDYSHAEGANTTASGYLSHAEGESTTASKNYSHAEGIYAIASGSGSHAEGMYSTASGTHSHAEGYETTASGTYSHAEGYGTEASGIQQHVQGKYNVEDTNNVYADIVGGGTSNNARANIETLDWSGNLTVAGNVTDGSGNVLSNKQDILTFDDAPTSASTNPVKSGGVYDALAEKQDIIEAITSTDPYTYRQGKGNLADIEIIGASVGWNQLVANSGTVSVTVPSGHKYLSKISGSWSISQSSGTAISSLAGGTDIIIDLTLLFGSTVADAIYAMETATAGAGVAFFRKYFPNDYYAYDAGSVQSVSVGSRKVIGFNQWDEIWENGGYNNLGQKTSSASIIRNKNKIPVLPNTRYYIKMGDTKNPDFRLVMWDINEELISSVAAIKSNYITTADNCYYIGFNNGSWYGNLYKNDICINISDPSKNGSYEPYTSTTYPFDSTKELRGLFSLEGGELKANGDIYTADGNIQRKYGIVDLGTLTWSIYDNKFQSPTSNIGAKSAVGICSKKYIFAGLGVSYITQDKQFSIGPNYINFRDDSYTDAATFKTAMSGVYLVYELATPTTESAQPYQNPQRAYIDGTEEFTDGLTRDMMIPVGNNTTYQQDKVLPSIEDYVDAVAEPKADISAIGTNETGATASKAYTTGQHFYKDGKFCTAISAIASGGTFTLNTNYSESDIATIIASLEARITALES